MKQNHQTLRALIAGTAYPVLFFPLTLLASTSLLNYPEFEFRPTIWIFPMILGLVNIGFWKFYNYIPTKKYESKLWITGVTLGILFPLFGISNNVPHLLFGFPAEKQFLVIPFGVIFYGCIWRFVVGKMNELLGLKKK